MRKIICAVGLLLLCSCGERDAHYDQLKKIEGDARLHQFEQYSKNERFRLYNKIYENSGHPHDAELSVGFRDNPEESLSHILQDLKNSEFTDFLRYLPIIYDLGKRTDVDICRSDHITPLKKVIDGYRLNAEQRKALEGLRFDRCELP